ncbi:MAG: type II toxin-antitoxin system Phd/YefM family antitoxin [Eggerthellaceae bacterium]|nr:type II toxin-antitoxin system Phd/YefM family antitoxin [Eggerthellaceae bacterium]
MPSVTISELQRNAKEIVDECVATGRAKRVTRHNESPVTLVKTERYLELLKMEIAVKERDFLVRKSLMRGWEDYQAGRATPLDAALAIADAKRGGASA